MKVVLAHNHYRSNTPSGENRMVRQMAVVLEKAGVDVVRFDRFSDDIESASFAEKLALPVSPIHSFKAQREFRELIERERPDVVQIHNPFPLISPSIIRVAAGAGVPVLNFVHNYRHVCLAGSMRRNDEECRRCIDAKSPLPALRNGCYRGSRAQTGIMALSSMVHRGTWGLVDRFVVVSGYVRDRLVEGGIQPSRIVVRHNTVPDPGLEGDPVPGSFLFAARLEADKGVGLLLEAWRHSGLGAAFSLEIAGSGPMESDVRRAAAELPGVTYLGQLDSGQMRDAFCRAGVVVLPSVWHDPCPLTAIEALANGRAVVATEMGGLPELIDGNVGWLSAPDPLSLAAQLQLAAQGPEGVIRRGRAARERYLDRFTPEGSIPALLQIHEDAAARHRTRSALRLTA